jgi:hypothetical protein
MAMRVATMSPMSSVDSSAPVREPGYLFRKLVLLLLLVTAATLWIVVLFKNQANFPLLLSTFFADVSLGLIAGFGSRSVLQKQTARLIAGIVLAILGMILIGNLTNWVLGVGPIRLEDKVAGQIHKLEFDRNLMDQIRSIKVDLRTLFDFSGMNWADPIHLVVSMMMTILSLFAWRRTITAAPSSQVVEVESLPVSQSAPRPRRGRRISTSSSSNSNGRARVQLPGGWLARLRPSPNSGRGTRSNNGSRPTVLREAKKGSDLLVRPKRKRSRRKAHIQFALVEDHRCPYCLDPVTRNDSRGVKECEVCHTLHHADCWAITGMCQVPHLNT